MIVFEKNSLETTREPLSLYHGNIWMLFRSTWLDTLLVVNKSKLVEFYEWMMACLIKVYRD